METFVGLMGLAVLLGIAHGFDADHLAAIDAVIRSQPSERLARARRFGIYFSLGHGVVMALVAVATSLLATRATPPALFEYVGGIVSIAFLFTLGFINLRLAFAPSDILLQSRVMGPRSWIARRLPKGVSAGAMVVIGAAFALSFDTLGQAIAFSIPGAQVQGVTGALLLAAAFTLGMMATDGLNGWIIARTIEHADRRIVQALRVLRAAVALVSVCIACAGVLRMTNSEARALLDERGMELSMVVIGSIAITIICLYLFGRRRFA